MLKPPPILRRIGSTTLSMHPLVIGGHGLLGEFKGRPPQSIESAAETLRLLAEAGATHFDYTYARERQAFRQVLAVAGLQRKLRPIIWYMDQQKYEGRSQNSAEELIDNVRYHLDELGCERAGAVIHWDHRWPSDWPSYTLDALQRLKGLDLTETIGLGVLAGARANESYLWDTWQHWDFIAPYWNYSLRRSQMLVEFARERGLGVYSVGVFLRGAVFDWPRVEPSRIVRPWLKWILREPSVCGMAVSLQSQAEAKAAIAACDGQPMSREDVQALYDMNLPIQGVDYRFQADGSSAAVALELIEADEQAQLAKNTNMLSGSLYRWRTPAA